MADTRHRTDPDLDEREELGREEAHSGAEPPRRLPTRTPEGRPRAWVVILALIAGIVVYGLAFQETEVDLEEITSETRQEGLTRILRDLARPDLVTYDTNRNVVATGIAVPCGVPVPSSGQLTVTPGCAAPGETVTVTGTGFTPGLDLAVEFVPDSEFAITLRLAETRVDAEGEFSEEVVIPERESDQPQEIIAVTAQPIGSWGDRVEVYTDANENGVEDDPILDESGARTVSVEAEAVLPGVALVDPANAPVQFVSTGEPFEAVAGLANGETAIPVAESVRESGVRLAGIVAAGEGFDITVEAPPGTDLSNWRLAVYDGSTGESQASTFITDTIELSPRVSETALNTLDKILETVFLALIATTAGVLLAVPFSFISARNLMRDISVPVTNLALTLLAVPLGMVAGAWAAGGVRGLVDPVTGTWVGSLAGTLVMAGGAWLLIRAGVPRADDAPPTRQERVRRMLLLVAAGVLGLAALLFVSIFLQQMGTGLTAALGRLGFIGTFFSSIGEILDVAFIVIAGIATAGLAANLGGRLGYGIRSHSPPGVVRTLNVVLSAAAGALWAILVGLAVDWFYQIRDPLLIVVIPGIIGAALGVVVAWRGMVKGEVAVGLSAYYASRTVFNALRSVEPLVMAIVFVVWVGLGPFAGSLALALHTTAALAKLYSEQVESILPGPIEAVRATGANRLQTIVYAVVPQIVPPYISFTMYRWDINVRMSTILGFVGGGGIGSILQQNINLVQYRAAAVQMLAIAIVVATMDYASARLRERLI